ncbi:hypothetical protein AALO_G00282830 [Alosa alosa]|uniref:Uncharacterized protein n=1 Tax=Alosa alosa TaxID=278164 RepID=A0AAV6FK80_9TELE|nr:hypothetical protein AALO_G00282830 [Alosa alosa]
MYTNVLKSSLSEESVQQVLSALPRQKSVGAVVLSVKTITITTAERLLQFYKTTQITEFVGVRLLEGADTAESLCSTLVMERRKFSDLLFPSQISDIILREILHRFHQLRHFTDKSQEHNECVDALLSWLASLPDLKGVTLQVSCLTEIWATRILQLIHTCPSLKRIQFEAAVYDESFEKEEGLLLEEGICLLRRPDCTITLTG